MHIWRLLAAAIIAFVPMSAGATTKACSEAVVEMRSSYPDLPNAAVTGLAARTESLYPKLAAFFGHAVRRPIIIDLSDSHEFSVSYAHLNMIGFPRHIVDENIAVLAHEMTHLFMPVGNSEALGEGIAIYVQDRFGTVGGYPNFGMDVDELLMRRAVGGRGVAVRTLDDADAIIGGYGYRRGFSDRARRDAYLFAGSFTRYLFDSELRADMAAFKRVYNSGNFARETGKSLAELEAAWRQKIGLPSEPKL